MLTTHTAFCQPSPHRLNINISFSHNYIYFPNGKKCFMKEDLYWSIASSPSFPPFLLKLLCLNALSEMHSFCRHIIIEVTFSHLCQFCCSQLILFPGHWYWLQKIRGVRWITFCVWLCILKLKQQCIVRKMLEILICSQNISACVSTDNCWSVINI